jgi:hypothetical protein
MTVRGLILTVALVAINIAAALATATDYPRLLVTGVGVIVGDSRGFTEGMSDGRVYVYNRPGLNREKNPHFQPPTIVSQLHGPRPTFLRIWSPVILTASITLTILAATARPLAQYEPKHDAIGGLPRKFSRSRKLLLALMVFFGIGGANFVAACTTSEYYPRLPYPFPPQCGPGGWSFRHYGDYYGEGIRVYKLNEPFGPRRITHAVWDRPRPSLLEIWVPVLVAVPASALAAWLIARRHGRHGCVFAPATLPS